MKYIVSLKYTNPSHEHVSLRRRVETRNSVVEARNEEEAILRASRQQRALGFLIKEAVIVKPELNEQVEQLDELHQGKEYTKKELVDKMKAGNWETGYDIKPGKHVEMKHRSGKKVSVYVKEETEQVDEVKAVKAYDKEGKLVGRYRSMDHAKQMKPGHTYKVEEEVVTEAKGEPPAEFMPSDTKLPRIKVPAKPKPGVRKRGPVGSFNKKGFWNPGVREEVEQVEEAKVSAVGASKASDAELANYLKKKLKKAQSNQAKGTAGYALLKKGKKLKPMKMEEEVELDEAKTDPKLTLKAMDLRHGVDADKRDAGYKMSDSVRKAQAKFDAQTKAQQVKKVQAGTLAAQRQRELARKTDLEEARTFKDVTAWKEAAKGHGYTVKQYAPDHHQAWTEDKRSGAPRVVGLFKNGKGDLTPPNKKVNEDLRRVKGKVIKSMNKLIQTAKNRKKALAVNVAPVMQEEKE